MSDTITALNKIVYMCGQREKNIEVAKEPNDEQLAEWRDHLLEVIAEIAGDTLEDHKAASLRAKPRKQRVYKEIVRQIAGILVDDPLDTSEGTTYAVELIQELLETYRITFDPTTQKLGGGE